MCWCDDDYGGDGDEDDDSGDDDGKILFTKSGYRPSCSDAARDFPVANAQSIGN